MFHAEETGWDLALLFKRKGKKGKEDVLRVAQKVTSTNPLPNARDLQRHLFGNSRSTGGEREKNKTVFILLLVNTHTSHGFCFIYFSPYHRGIIFFTSYFTFLSSLLIEAVEN
jgi:hypothetical protein